jgi:predicted AlkP superfamily phosphohydrolase/phosphomutase
MLFGRKRPPKVLVIGLDSAPPDWVFGRWLDSLPNLKALCEEGVHGEIQSSVPPITVPAWACFTTSKNPGKLGFFGFRNRRDWSYDDISLASLSALREDTVWDLLSRHGKRSIMIGVPPMYPPRPLNGLMVGCFLTPDTSHEYTYPADLAPRLERLAAPYMVDVDGFRTEDKHWLLKQCQQMTDGHFRAVKDLLRSEDWDLFMFVEIGPDRMQHGFWKFMDPQHPKHQPGSEFERAIPEYYRRLDDHIGDVLGMLPDESAVIVVSDHGAKAMRGSISINEWLAREGWLSLRSTPSEPTPLKKADIDWAKTTAWAWGGYHSRVFLNLKGREAEGRIEPADRERVREELAEAIAAISDHEGKPLATRVLRPEEVYSGPYVERAPDLTVYFDDLWWRASQDLGHGSVHGFETEVGPDDAVHAEKGLFILRTPRLGRLGLKRGSTLTGLDLLDGAPTILGLMDVPVPADMEGRPAWERGA